MNCKDTFDWIVSGGFAWRSGWGAHDCIAFDSSNKLMFYSGVNPAVVYGLTAADWGATDWSHSTNHTDHPPR